MTAILALRTQAPAGVGLELPKGEHATRDPRRSFPGPLDRAQYRLIFAVCFTAFLLETIAARAMPWCQAPPGEPKRSILAQARAATDRTIPFAFMG
jgi:hypothetical protein